MLINAVILRYDTKKYPFARILERDVFRIKPLGELHHFWIHQKKRGNDESSLSYADNLTLRHLIQRLPDSSVFYQIYNAFLANEIAPHYGHRIRVTKHPKMRVHLDGTPSVSAIHRDVDVTHRPDQINVFLPFTDCDGTNSLWCESNYGIGDFAPVKVKYGEALLFDGGYLRHYSVANQSGISRVSMDFRFTPINPETAEPPWSTILAGRIDKPDLDACG